MIELVQGSRLIANFNEQFEDFSQKRFNEKTRKRKPRFVLVIRLSLNC